MKNKKKLRNRYFLILDILIVLIIYAGAIAVAFPLHKILGVYYQGKGIIIITTMLYVAFMAASGTYFIDFLNAGSKEYARLFCSCLVSAVVSIALGLNVSRSAIFPKLNIMVNLAIVVCIFAVRVGVNIAYRLIRGYARSANGKNILLIGAGRLAFLFLRDLEDNSALNYNVVGMIDDDPQKRRLIIDGKRVLGTRNDIEKICKENSIDEIIFAIYSIPAAEKKEILNICSRTGKKLKILPGFEAVLSGSVGISSVRDVAIEDLLERDTIELDNELIGDNLTGKTVLVTGGGGSIGSELCRQIVKYSPKKLIILDIYENTTYELQNELETKNPCQDLEVLIGSVRDRDRISFILNKYRPEIVFHAAAHKHVPLMEDSPGEAIKNNVFGTYNLALCSDKYGVKRFVMISTDKAVNPTNIMGASKRMCEMIIQTLQKTCTTEFVAVRFGNVLGSNGSVVPRFKHQIETGGPVTVTHPEITRYFMTIPEAAQLVLQAAAYAKGGEIFVLDMGEPVKIYDLAKKMISLSGLKPDVDIKIEFTGLRPGEKLYEELLMGEEGLKKTAHSKIFVGKPIDISPKELTEKLKLLEKALDGDTKTITEAMRQAVPTYVVPQLSSILTE